MTSFYEQNLQIAHIGFGRPRHDQIVRRSNNGYASWSLSALSHIEAHSRAPVAPSSNRQPPPPHRLARRCRPCRRWRDGDVPNVSKLARRRQRELLIAPAAAVPCHLDGGLAGREHA